MVEDSFKRAVPGDLISLKPGNIIPADVKVLNKSIYVNESSITGEATPVTRAAGSNAFSGTEVLGGNCLATVSQTGLRSRAGKTSQLTLEAKAPGQLQVLLGRVIKYLAILDACLIVILLLFALLRHENIVSLMPFLAMLVIATIPIAMPSSFSVANSIEANVLSNQSILVRDLTGIQEAANMNLLLMDKTGTITTAPTSVKEFHSFSNYSQSEINQLALAAMDTRQPSQTDTALLNFIGPNTSHLAIKSYQAFNPNIGYSAATINVNHEKKRVRLGSLKILAKKSGQEVNDTDIQGHTVALSLDNQLLGFYILGSQLRPDALSTLEKLKRRGVRIMILTGDYHQSTEQIIQQTGLSGKVITGKELDHLKSIDGITAISEVLPENKLAAVKKCQELGFTVGMIGDGINDAPALKLANIGIATANATDIAKQAAKLILMKDSLLSITNIIDSGHRVYQRMMTWTITKLVRTAELTILLTLGYLFFRFIPLSLNALVLIAILNDLVTMVLGTDNTQITYHPEKWGFKKIINQASVLTIGWTVVALAILVMLVQHLPASKISSILFLFLIASAMLTILMTRTTKLFWLGRPSSAVLTATSANLAIAILASTFGWGIAIISFSSIGITILATVVASLVLNVIQRFSWN